MSFVQWKVQIKEIFIFKSEKTNKKWKEYNWKQKQNISKLKSQMEYLVEIKINI